MTELPPHLTRPGFWLEDDLDPALEVADGVEGPICPKVYRGRRAERCPGWLAARQSGVAKD